MRFVRHRSLHSCAGLSGLPAGAAAPRTRKCFSAFLGHHLLKLEHFWRVLSAAYFCAAFVTPQLVASRCAFRLPSGLCYSLGGGW